MLSIDELSCINDGDGNDDDGSDDGDDDDDDFCS